MCVIWNKPPINWIKHNVDGSCKGNLGSCGGGGILRDDQNRFRVTFSKKLADGTNKSAKILALIYGVKLCKRLEFKQISIKIDYELVVGWIPKKICNFR